MTTENIRKTTMHKAELLQALSAWHEHTFDEDTTTIRYSTLLEKLEIEEQVNTNGN